jgi:hypothetical protein
LIRAIRKIRIQKAFSCLVPARPGWVEVSMMSDRCEKYIALISAFVNGEMEAVEFEAEYLKLFKQDTTEWPEAEYAILDELFGDVDAFCADPQLRSEEDLDEYELKERSRTALEKLQALVYAST